MTITDQRQIEFQARGSSGSSWRATTALSIALIFAQYANGLHLDTAERRPSPTLIQGTAARAESLRITELDLFAQINRIFDGLLKTQVDLDSDARRALYENLWDLYA